VISLSNEASIAVALLAGAWLAAACWFAIRGARKASMARGLQDGFGRYRSLLKAGPSMPVVIHPDGTIESFAPLDDMLGLSVRPESLSMLVATLGPEQAVPLQDAVREAASAGASRSLRLEPEQGSQLFRVHCSPAPPPYPAGAVLLWFVDITQYEHEMATLGGEVDKVNRALDALSAMIEVAPFPIWHRGPDLRLAMVNSAYVQAVEAQDAVTVIAGGIELVDEADGRSALELAAEVKERGESANRTVPATIAGERRMVRLVEVPLGQAGVAGYAIDVEDREQARADLARFVRAQRDMLDRLSAGVAQFARDRSLTFFNRPFARLFSLRAEWLADRPEFDRVIDRMRESGHLPEVRDFPDWKQEKRGWFTAGLTADEEDWLLPGGKHLRVVAQPLPDGGLLLIFEDRTEQIQLASARDTLLRVRTATFDNLFEAVGVFASDGRLNLWNNRFSDLWQFEEEQLAAHPRVDALMPLIAKKLKNPAHASLMRELVRSATVERKQRKGRVSLIDGRDFEFAAVPLPDGNALFTMLDITDARIIEQALRERNEALEDADRLKTAFVSNMSYELRTPLTSIGGFAEMLAGGYAGKLEPQAEEYVGAILESVVRLSALIDNVLDLTQSESGGLLLAEDNVDLDAMCREAAFSFKAAAEQKELKFKHDLHKSVGSIVGDRKRLRQSLDNILRNAIAYTAKGGEILLRARGTDQQAQIIVSDTGKGIKTADRNRVFDRFHRTAQSSGGEAASLGLGLPLARQFIEAHGGTITLDSEPDAGTTVTIILPRSAPDS
jgi:signal transduction histidine kinase